ncbi:MAG: hypothetical protein F9K19_01225 [Rhizobiaceae bacterium]|nr:MAG: hypothetical protein F9K19_01225 [Rhizobiaceae bacterium]
MGRFSILCLGAVVAVVLTWLSPASPALAETPACAAAPADTPLIDVVQPDAAAVVGEPVAFRWTRTKAASAKSKASAYMVLAVPEATRFEGRGFFALAPGARGPHDMEFGKDRSRAIVPLSMRFARPSGAIEVLPYRAGPMDAEWAIVVVSACGEAVAASGTMHLDVAPGAPRLVARDPFSARRPTAEVVPFAGPFRARVFEGAVEVADARSGEVILQATGNDPVFSPTGRFIALRTNEDQVADIYDLVAERRIGRFQSIAMYWSHADSFLYLDQEWAGALQIVRTLHGRRDLPEETPRLALLNEFRMEEETVIGEGAIHGGRDAGGEDFDPGEGGASFTSGSEAWSLELSLESGVVAFLATNPFFYPDPTDELPGRIIDLGLLNPMIVTKRRSQLSEVLSRDFAMKVADVVKWNAHDTLRRTFIYYDDPSGEVVEEDAEGTETAPADAEVALEPIEEPIDFSEAPTQTVTTGGSAIAGVGAGATDVGDGSGAILRGAVAIVPSVRPFAATADALLDLLPDRTIAPLRSGIDDDRIGPIAAELDALYPDVVARFGTAAEEGGGYLTFPFPDPSPATLPGDGVLIDLLAEGRDTWRWIIGGDRFWLTETVESGRLSHAFSFTLLGERGGLLRHADLLAHDQLKAERASEEEGAPLALINRGDARGELGSTFSEPSYVGVAGGRYVLVATRPIARLIAFDLVGWTPACSVAAPLNAADIDRLSMTADGRHVAQINKDGRVEIYACADGRHVLSGLVVDDELVLMDRNGYFDGSEDAAGYVELKIAGLPGRHLLSQFAGRLRYPGLARAAFAGAAERAPIALNPPSLTVSNGSGALRIDLRAARGLRSLDVYVDGRLARRWALDGTAASLALDPAELPPAAFATLLAIDREGFTSPPTDVVLGTRPSAGAGRLLGLVVGVDSYPKMPDSDLRFAAADARRIAGAVATSRLYRSIEVGTLLDEEATAEAVLVRVEALIAGAGEGDTLLFSFAGHGLIGGDGRLRLALSSTDRADMDGTSLPFDAVAARIKTAKARVVVLLDACHSGVSGQADPATNEDAVAQLVTEGGAGIVILSASKGRQFSEELAGLGGGRFSVAIAEALSPGRAQADIDGNGAVSLLELYRAVKASVAGGSEGRQIPWIARNQIYGDFDVF